jgi:guanine deaminase
MIKIYLCSILNPLTDKKCEFIREGALAIRKDVIIDKGEAYKIIKKFENKSLKIIHLENKIIMPTFFDMHFHWVQDDVCLMPKDSLLEWLSKYTWPYEAKFKSLEYTKKKVAKFKKELLSTGTLGGACFASIHPHTVDLAIENFVGDFVIGNVLMTMNSPEYLIQTEVDAITSVTNLSAKFKSKYALTPRFAPTTSPEVMIKASKIAKKNRSFVQSHLSETQNEIEYVLDIYKKIKGFEKVKSYTDIYNKCGILSSRTIMGHGIYLSKAELLLLKKSKTALAHCPTSNAPIAEKGLGSGLFNFQLTEKYKIPWALGSDIGGGPYLSMFDVMRSFVEQNKKKKVEGATYTKALYRATCAGARILKLEKSQGNLEKNKMANFIVVKSPTIKIKDSAEDILKKLIGPYSKKRSKFDQIVEQTFYQGNLVYSKSSKTTGQWSLPRISV